LHIRIWQHGDLPWLQRAVMAAAVEDLPPGERRVEVLPLAAQRSLEQLHLLLQHGIALIADRGGDPVGFTLLTSLPDAATGEPTGTLIGLWVQPADRRQGVGRLLTATAEALFAHRGIKKVKLWTGVHNQGVLRLGEHRGYHVEALIREKAL
jgi:ribosomal protein S18 acetylase RimI-like enzyme